MAQTVCRDCQSFISPQAKACPHCGRPNDRTSPATWGCLLLIIVPLMLVGICSVATHEPSSEAPQPATTAVPQKPQGQAYAAQFVKITKQSWELGGFDTVMIANLTVKNSGVRDVKDLRLVCSVAGKSGTEIASPSTTLYDVVPAGESKRFRGVRVGFVPQQAATAGCTITDLTVQ